MLPKPEVAKMADFSLIDLASVLEDNHEFTYPLRALLHCML